MINFFSKFKIFFYVINLLLIIFYLFPGSLFGCIFFDDCKVQPQITSDFLHISSNHFYAFGLVTILGYLTFLNSKKLQLSPLINFQTDLTTENSFQELIYETLLIKLKLLKDNIKLVLIFLNLKKLNILK